MSEQFRNHTIEKIYHAVVEGKPKKEKDTLVHWLQKDESKNKTTVNSKQTIGSQMAELNYEVVQSNGEYSLLKIKLGTGRSHQIRAQLSAIGCPIVGDIKYGAPEQLPDRELALAATSLSFETATGGEKVVLEAPVPEEWATYYM